MHHFLHLGKVILQSWTLQICICASIFYYWRFFSNNACLVQVSFKRRAKWRPVYTGSSLIPQQPPSTCNPSNSHFKMLINPDREIQKPFQPGFGHIQETSKDKWRQRRSLIFYSPTSPWFDHHCTRRQQPVNQILFWEAASSGLFGKREASEALIPQSFLQTGSFSSSCYVKL